MALDASFVERIEHPEHAILQDALAEASTNTKTRLQTMGIADPEEWLVRKLAYAYFHDWTTDAPRIMFLLPDPGQLGTRFTTAVQQFRRNGPDHSCQAQVSFYRHLATEWLLHKTTDFSARFFPTLADLGVIDYTDGWQPYVATGAFFDDVYLTDVLKYRLGGYTARQEQAAVQEHLTTELAAIDPELILTFGANAWGTARDYLDARPVSDAPVDTSQMMATHGHLCRTHARLDTFVLPLSHMSGHVWYRFPPDEYIERLEAGLRDWQPPP